MSDQLNIASLQSRLEIVETDIKKLQADGGSPRKVEALTEYKKYLEDELRLLEHGHKS
jgi:hypothetical protein